MTKEERADLHSWIILMQDGMNYLVLQGMKIALGVKPLGGWVCSHFLKGECKQGNCIHTEMEQTYGTKLAKK